MFKWNGKELLLGLKAFAVCTTNVLALSLIRNVLKSLYAFVLFKRGPLDYSI